MSNALPKPDLFPLQNFLRHFTKNLLIGFVLTVCILLIGITGYRYFEEASWIDAYANSAMIISGVGTLTNPQTTAGKLFVATFSIFGGGTFLLIVAVVFSPIFHWLFRQFHVEDREHFSNKL